MKEIVNSWLTKLAVLKLNAIKGPKVHAVHAGIALLLVLFAHLIGLNKWLAGAIMLAVAFGIEFWFDAKYEAQPLEDNLHDFEDYLVGVLISWLM